jgi:hypothetical protein
MTCPDYTTSKSGRSGLGVVQPQSGLDYPLVSPSEDIQYLVADLHLSYDDAGEYDSGAPKATHPLRIKYLYGIGCVENTPAPGFPVSVHAADIVVVDSHNRVILDTNHEDVLFNVSAWGADYRIYEWKTARAVCRLVTYTTWPNDDNQQIDDDTRRQYDKYLAPSNARLDERAVYKMPKRLLTLRVRNGNAISPRYTESIKFVNGYNTEIVAGTAETKNFRNNTKINFTAVAGTGLGRYGNCGGNVGVPLTKINGLSSDNGDFRISGTDCLWARRPVSVGISPPYAVNPSTTAHQQIGADCEPCCSCNDYAATAKYMNDTSYRYRLIGQRADKVRTEHENNIARWLDQRACSVQRPLRLFLVPQRCAYMDVVMMLCNPCETCVNPSRLTVTLDVSGDLVALPGQQTPVHVTPSLECGHTAMYAPGIRGGAIGITVSSDGRNYTAAFPQLKPGSSAYVQFRVKFTQLDDTQTPSVETRARGPYVITGVLTGALLSDNSPILTNCGVNLADGFPPPAAVSETVQTLHCNADGKTEGPC